MIDKSFRQELTALINRHGLDSQCDTPDYVLSDFVCETLHAFMQALESHEPRTNAPRVKP